MAKIMVLAAAKYGVDITQCSICKTGKLVLVATYINIAKEGVHLVNANELHSRGSPRKIPIAV